MNKKLHPETEEDDEQSKKELAAAYSFLSKLSDTEFESFLTRETILPPEYEKEVQKYLSQPIQKRIAEWKQNAAAANQPSLREKVRAKLKEFFAFADLPQFGTTGSEVFCSDTAPDKSEQRILDLLDKYDEAELNEKLPWAAHRVIVMKVPVEKSGGVYYRALIEQREGETAKTGSLKIVLHAGEHTDKVKLGFDFPNRTFPKSVPADAPVSFELILE
jgi:hypothetical protein